MLTEDKLRRHKAPEPIPAVPPVELPPDGPRYRLKRKLLGPPLDTDQLVHERLGKPTALAVFASDNLSSSAYATEEILRVLVPAVGVAAFALVLPITVAMLVVLGFLILSYRQTIKAYPSAGGAYIVTRDNFGLLPAQVAGVALLTDYVLTVAVSVAAGTAALSSAAPVLAPYAVPISVAFIVLIAFGNLHVDAYGKGTPTVVSQVGKLVFGAGPAGHVLFYCLQAGTMLILVLAANTSFADFPRLASFHAGDNFMPRQLTKRGHRLVFSNGIISLAAAAAVLVIVTGAKVDHLIPLYAIGVFTSFTLSQAGMAKHHVTHKEPGWQGGLFVNGMGALLSLVVDIVIAVTKFTHGAWVICVLVPFFVAVLVRLNRQYESESTELERDARQAAEAPILRRHVVLVLVDSLDLSAARAIQYARTLAPDELRAVHVAGDLHRAEELAAQWRRLGLARVSLELVDCPDRRIARSVLEVVAEATADGQTEVSVLVPRRMYRRSWHKLLHDRTADSIARVVSRLPHANVTFVPYHLGATRHEEEKVR